jgi:hypothetical protein
MNQANPYPRKTRRTGGREHVSRRGFLKTMGALPVAVAAARAAAPASAAPAAQAVLPQIQFGPHRVSRVVCGSNPFNANSHLSVFVNYEMRQYFTPEQILKTLRRCQTVGINCWQSGHWNYDLHRRFLDEGGRMHFLAIESGKSDVMWNLPRGGCIGIAHHGAVTDELFKTGRLEEIHDFLKRVHDAGILAGVSTHMPDVVDAIESKGWELDYYMTSVYQWSRSEEELKRLLGRVPPPHELYLPEDPPRMFQSMRNTKRPCLAFKILAAGRLSESKELVERAFRETYALIKPTDGAIVGIYDRYSDQPGENAKLVRKYGSSPRTG